MVEFITHTTANAFLIGVEVEFYFTFSTMSIGFASGAFPGYSFIVAMS